MVDLTAQEGAAIRATLQPVAALIDTIGWQSPPSAWSQEQMLQLITVAIGWQSPPSAWSQEQMLQLITVAIDGFQTAMHQAAVDDPMEVPF
ncbi:DUF6511 domain-containing protein [Novosphingobium sp. ES2-1]|uniref:DUF6511 domain-containing protein n=1 Tax=Novosphingobium sp. ES2-1 TaxID=2780074 RepID=UPI001880E552|nr:DUF6511 domain-containing protein [Novosphingobium sp. ES2-1]QOV92982.1 hypothetical protein IM701_09960 [Novosphingobium sp. ES2-1]